MSTTAELRKALAAELQADRPNSDKIAELAAALVDSDRTRARFSVDAGMLARLGRELVARHETALSELVKNAYDADAQQVAVRIASPSKGDYIEVADDGHGMTQDAFIKGFMRLATSDKLEHPMSPGGRRRAGRKGVGRFAAERLGKKLILTTATADAPTALRMEVEWDRFAPGRELASIFVPIEETPKTRPHGTTLRIERLRDSWPAATVERTFEHVAELIDLGDQTRSSGAVKPVFNVTFTGDGKGHQVFDIRSQVASQSYATIEAQIDGQGRVTWSLICPALKIIMNDRELRVGEKESNRLKLARSVRLRAQYYILESKYFPPTVFRTVRAYLATNGGIRLYRNGFRVQPYGQEGDDWLSLDLISSQRSKTLAPVRNRNFLGSVSIQDETGLFEETSSREGLISSPAFEELSLVMSSAILTGVREIDAERSRLDLKGGRPPPPPPPQSTQTELDLEPERTPGHDAAKQLTEAVEAVTAEIGRSNPSPEVTRALERVTSTVEEVVRRAEQSDRLLKEIDLLRVLASMGLAIGQFTHEFSTLSGAMRASLAILLETGRSEAERGEAASSIRTLLDQARDFTGLFKSMTEENALRERQAIELYGAVTGFRSAMRTVLDRNGVKMDIDELDDDVSTPPMHRSELFAILLNFTSNSIKAIKRNGAAGRILVRLRAGPAREAVIEFADNGDGISSEVIDTLFDPFVTTTAAAPASAAEDEMAIGSGLGLAIVRDIVNAAGGTVTVGDPPLNYATNMVVSLPAGEVH